MKIAPKVNLRQNILVILNPLYDNTDRYTVCSTKKLKEEVTFLKAKLAYTKNLNALIQGKEHTEKRDK